MSDDTYRLIGSRIAIARKAANMDQRQLADAIGCHFQTLSRWERGIRTPNGDEIKAICFVLHCSADFLLGLSDTLIVRKCIDE